MIVKTTVVNAPVAARIVNPTQSSFIILRDSPVSRGPIASVNLYVTAPVGTVGLCAFKVTFLPGRTFASLADFSQQLVAWLATANTRVVRRL